MAVNFPGAVYAPNFDFWARPIQIDPRASQPGLPAYDARGIFDTDETNVIAEDAAMFSDQRTFIDILETEFTVLPVQLDRVFVPADANAGLPELGWYEVTDASTNGGGETTLMLRKVATAKPS